MTMVYSRIAPLPADFHDAEATSVESLRDAWIEQRAGLAEGGALSTFNQKLVRRWAIETGIVERLYTLDRGTTEILVSKGLDSALIQHGSSDLPAGELVAILRDHQSAAAYVTDHVSQRRGLTLGFIKSLHQMLTAHQEYVEAEDQFGSRFATKLIRGDWKTVPNNPRRPDGIVHGYCSPELVVDEMESLVKLYLEMEEHVPAVTRAAWLHHRFTQIHPFQDGNGRVARALTMFALVTKNCFPLVVDRDVRDTYIGCLEEADAGDIRPLVRLFSRLEKKELEQALSMSEDALSSTASSATSIRSQLLAAIRESARGRRIALDAKRKEVLSKGHSVFHQSVVPAMQDVATQLHTVLAEELPGSDARVEVSDDAKRHFFKTQIVRIAQKEGYYGDFSTAHEWVRLRVQRPGQGDTNVSEIVVSMHSLGRHFTGVLVMTAYFATRLLDEDGRSVTLEPHRLSDRSLTFSYLESEENIESRTNEWINSVLNLGLAQLQPSI